MIRFKKITAKNFLSYGNVPTVIELDKNKSTLVAGKNGSGKSSLILDGISFALYGKAFRKINLGQLINSINQKDCQVTIEFSVGTDEFRVFRSLKPNKLEIYKNDELINQEAAVKDYQGFLEKNILKISYKTFTQVFVLGSATFTPFMQLPAGIRREVVEDVLDIGVFAQMNRLLRERVSVLRDELAVIDVKIESAKTNTQNQKRLIDFMSSSRESRLQELQTELDHSEKEVVEQENLLEKTNAYLEDTTNQEPPDFSVALSELRERISATSSRLRDNEKKRGKIQHLDTCPTCLQKVGDVHKHSIDVNLAVDIESLEKDLSEMKREELIVLSPKQILRDDWVTRVDSIKKDIVSLRKELATKIADADKIRTKINDIKNSTIGDIDEERRKLKETAANVLVLIERRNALIEERSIQEVSVSLLKDSGIKASIVKEYLPILNKLINKYLVEFEFFVNFELDENFNETIKSRGRDEFSYMSFSEGEKKRIDVAILLAFRQIASMKNSAKINLLISDEVDGGLDGVALEKFVSLMTDGIDANVWVISHVLSNTELVNMFESQCQVKKIGDFSTMEII